MATLERVAAHAGVYDEPGGDPTVLDFTDDATSALIEHGDTLVLLAYGSELVAPGGDWVERWSAGFWAVWSKPATARETLPVLEAGDNGGDYDPAGVLLVYRRATPSYLVGTGAELTTVATTTHESDTATVIDSNGRLLAAWLGWPGGPAPVALVDPIETVLSEQTSDASGAGPRWFTVAEAPITAVPDAGTVTLSTAPTAADVAVAILPLRARPPFAPAALVDAGAGANIGLLP